MPLNNELITGHAAFDGHHARLLEEIDQLRGICRFDTATRNCGQCADAVQIACRHELHGFGRAFAHLWMRETSEEERLLRALPLVGANAGPIESHLQGHADISDLIVTATAAAQNIEHGLHVIFEELPRRIHRHIVECDQWLVAQLAPPDPA